MSAQYKGQTINKVVLLEVKKILPNPSQPRMQFDQDEIESLAVSIVTNGLLQPLTVRRCARGFELISGERRLRAMQFAGVELAPSIIVDTDEKQSAVYALLENLQRENLNFFEEAVAIRALIQNWEISQQEVGVRLGKAQSTIANKLRLLRFDEKTQTLMLRNGITERQARALLKVMDKRTMEIALNKIIKGRLNVTQTDKYIEELLSEKGDSKRTVTPIVKDVRIFLNTIANAITVMNESGIEAQSERRDCGDHIEYTVKIPIKQHEATV